MVFTALLGFAPPAMAEEDGLRLLLEDAPEIELAPATSGWYLRGDLGIGLASRMGGAADITIEDLPALALTESRLGKGATLGIGVGYQLRSWLRADLTVEWQQSRFEGVSAAGTCATSPSGSCRIEAEGRAQHLGFLANVYGDLGTFAGFTPYVGAGAGFTRVDWGTVTASSLCDGQGCGTTDVIDSQSLDGAASFRFTHALMAGVAYDISDRLQLDFGYRYRHVAGGTLFAGDGDTVRDGGFSQHDLRIGLRYLLP